jgi:hypothetical protein
MIVQQGQINTTALIVPGLIVQIVPPSWTLLNGVPTNVLGIVGTAIWGPVNSPTIASGITDASAQFGAMQPRKYDLNTAVAAASLQGGAAALRLVRVTDGTDTASHASFTCASSALATAIAAAINNGQSGLRGPSRMAVATTSGATLTLTAFYTGTLGNSMVAGIGPGAGVATTKLTLAIPGQVPEIFDSIGAATSTASTATFSSGTDGATTITSSVLIGVDTVPRTGMYSLRSTGCSVAMLADCDDSTQWTTQVTYGLSEGTYMISTSPAGDTITNFASTIASAGIDSYAIKLLLGDWCYINDNVNGVVRLISPQGFIAGLLANLAPNQSTLNKPLLGIIATQKSYANQKYSNAELQALGQARGDVIANPCPGGNYFGAQFGHNTSSNAVIHGDNYTRMTNYIASTLNAGMGSVVGKPITPSLVRDTKATLNSFFAALKQGSVGLPDGMINDFQVIMDLGKGTNNPLSRTALGYLQADCKVQYQAITEFFIVNLQGGQSVVIQRSGAEAA